MAGGAFLATAGSEMSRTGTELSPDGVLSFSEGNTTFLLLLEFLPPFVSLALLKRE